MFNWLPLLIFIAVALLAWRYPKVAVWLVTLALPAYVVKFFIGPVPTTLLEIILWATLIGWFSRDPLPHLRALWRSWQPLLIPLLLLAVGLVVGVVVSSDLRLSLGIAKAWFVDPILFYGLVVAIYDLTSMGSLVTALLLSTLPISIMAIGQVITGHYITIDHRASAWFESANYLSLYIVPILLLGTHWVLAANRAQKFLFYGVAILGLIALYFSFSYGGWLALIAGAIVLGLWHFRRYWLWWLGGIGVVGLAVLGQVHTPRVINMLNLAVRSSASVRLQVWMTDWLMTKLHWLTGIGLGQYPVHYAKYVVWLFPTPLEPAMLHAHDLYFQFVLNLGIIGLVGFVWLTIVAWRWLLRGAPTWAPPLAAALTTILIHGLVDTSYWKNDLSMIWWAIIAFAALSRHPISRPPNE